MENFHWVVTKALTTSSVGVGIVLLNAVINSTENLIFDNIEIIAHISDIGEKSYMALLANAKHAKLAMQLFGCFFLDKQTIRNATSKIHDVIDVTFGNAYLNISAVATYLFGENSHGKRSNNTINTKTNQSKLKDGNSDNKPGETLVFIKPFNTTNNNNNTFVTDSSSKQSILNENDEDVTSTSLKLVKNIAYISMSTLNLGLATVAFVPLFSLQCLCNPRLLFLGSIRVATLAMFVLAHPVHTHNLLIFSYYYNIYGMTLSKKLESLQNSIFIEEQKEVEELSNNDTIRKDAALDMPTPTSSVVVLENHKTIIKVRVVKANNLKVATGFFAYWQTSDSYVEVYLISVDEETEERFVEKIGVTTSRNSTSNLSWEHSDEVIEFEALHDDVKTVVEKIHFKIFSGGKQLGDAETYVPSAIDNNQSYTFLQNPNTTPTKNRSISSNSSSSNVDYSTDDGFVLSNEDEINTALPKVESIEKIPSFDSLLATRVLTIFDLHGNIDTGTLTINIGRFYCC
jgi:hypothetical protein